MGATDFMFSKKGTDVKALFREARDAAQYEHGHGGYTGTIAEKSDVEVRRAGLPVLDRTMAEAFAENDIEENDKWGPAFAVAFGENGQIEGYIFYGFASE